MDEIVREFLLETTESLQRLDQELVRLERETDPSGVIAGVFRTFHSIKGSAGFLGFEQIGRLAHAGENVLGRLREGRLEPTSKVIASLLAVADVLREMLGDIEAGGSDQTRDYTELIASLDRLESGPATTSPVVAPPPLPEPEPEDRGDATIQMPPPGAAVGSSSSLSFVFDSEAASLEAATGFFEPAGGSSLTILPVEPPPPPAVADPPPAATVPSPAPEAPTPAPARPPATMFEAEEGGSSLQIRAHGPAVSETTVRVDVTHLDRLMNLVGELVLARNRIVQRTADASDTALVAATRQLDAVTTALQEGVMKARMQPIRNAWATLPRLVRDLEQALGKRVSLVLEGEETELDRSILEAIKDPIVHLVRNAIDHGIEAPGRRMTQGKPPEGTLRIAAAHAGGQVLVEITDDGAGIDPERMRRKAVERGVIAAERADRLGDEEALSLVFLPGFSTAEQLTLVSGRGVGMDVAKTSIEAIGGRVEIRSRPGQGTTVSLALPLTLSILRALAVSTDGARYVIPQANLIEVVRPRGDGAAWIEVVHEAPVLRYRGHLLPLVVLAEALGRPGREPIGPQANVAVLQAGLSRFGLVLDRVEDTQEIVVRPLAKLVREVGPYAGATILGDGRVALILDVSALAKQVGLGESPGGGSDGGAPTAARAASGAADRDSILLLRKGDGRRAAVPIGLVERVERVPRNRVDELGGRPVVAYRGGILRLIDAGGMLDEGGGDEGRDLHAVVCTVGHRRAGLLFAYLDDVVDDPGPVEGDPPRPGVLYTTIAREQIVEVLDVPSLIADAAGGA